MAGYFALELDTTGPQIEIYAPKYTDKHSNNLIRIVSNEKMSSFQDIYIIDSQGARHDVIFSFDGDKTFTGNVVFSDYSIGVATIYAQLKDEVNNLSNLVDFPISIITSTYNFMLRLSMSEETKDNLIVIKERKYISSEKQKMTELMSEKTMTISTNLKETNSIASEKETATTISDKNNTITISEKPRFIIVSDID